MDQGVIFVSKMQYNSPTSICKIKKFPDPLLKGDGDVVREGRGKEGACHWPDQVWEEIDAPESNVFYIRQSIRITQPHEIFA